MRGQAFFKDERLAKYTENKLIKYHCAKKENSDYSNERSSNFKILKMVMIISVLLNTSTADMDIVLLVYCQEVFCDVVHVLPTFITYFRQTNYEKILLCIQTNSYCNDHNCLRLAEDVRRILSAKMSNINANLEGGVYKH